MTPIENIIAMSDIERIVAKNLGLSNIGELKTWAQDSLKDETYWVNGIDQAASIVLKHRDDKISIVGDYDADGITATALLSIGLRALGITDIQTYIPKRISDGYGLNARIVNEEIDGDLLITVDNGIMAHEAIDLAKKKGMEVVVLDHHISSADQPPAADVVVDPSAIENSARFREYCGCGLAYKLIQELCNQEKFDAKPKLLAYIRPLVAIATIADVVPLRHENYILVKSGLQLLSKGIGPAGLVGLVRAVKGEESGEITETDVSFKIAPCINASGRIADDGGTMILQLLTASAESATTLIEQAIENNRIRRLQTSAALERAKAALEDREQDHMMVVYLPGTNEGILGLIAAKICEGTNLPAVVLTDSAAQNGVLKGSARSPEGFNIHEALLSVSDLLLSFGGHAAAAGLSLELANLGAFMQRAKSITATGIHSKTVVPDLVISEDQIADTVLDLRKLAPYGEGNPEPLFKIKYDLVSRYGAFQQKLSGKTVKFFGESSEAIAFNCPDDIPEDLISAEFVGKLSVNTFRGKNVPQIEVWDIIPLKTGGASDADASPFKGLIRDLKGTGA